jgi:hypothetical protein
MGNLQSGPEDTKRYCKLLYRAGVVQKLPVSQKHGFSGPNYTCIGGIRQDSLPDLA